MQDKPSDAQTHFAPAGRASEEALHLLQSSAAAEVMLCSLIDCMPGMVVLLNVERQAILANKSVYDIIGNGQKGAILGKRPGELFGCVHACDSPGGCGTGRHCAACGAVATIMTCQETHRQVSGECTIARSDGAIIEFSVHASPFMVGKSELALVYFRDISHEKRRRVLERVFFHDVMNSAGAVSGLLQLLHEGNAPAGDRDAKMRKMLERMVNNLIREIKDQRMLSAAEVGEFRAVSEFTGLNSLLDEMSIACQGFQGAEGKTIKVEAAENIMIDTDPVLLRRVLENMAKNAVEASPKGAVIIFKLDRDQGRPRISINNPGVMLERVQLQVFERSFSTKGEQGRGIGTYSIKLFGEKYLGGKVGFTSREPEGTTFFITLPKSLPAC